MIKLLFFLQGLMLVSATAGQINIEEYNHRINKADSVYNTKNYKQAANLYSEALALVGKRAWISDRVSAARTWFLIGQHDSAYNQLRFIAVADNLTYEDIDEMISREDLEEIRKDILWDPVKVKMYLTAYKNLLAAQSRKQTPTFSLSANDSVFALQLGEHSTIAFSHVNKKAFGFLKMKKYSEAYQFIRASIKFFSPNPIFYRNMMDYYKATGDKSRAYIYFSKAAILKYKDLTSESLMKVDSDIKKDYHDFNKMVHGQFLPPEYLVRIVALDALKKGMKEKALLLFKMNLENYPTSYAAHADFATYYEKTGDKQKADEFKTRSLLLQYQLPPNFFEPDFDIEKYIKDRQVRLTRKTESLPLPPEAFINDIANQLQVKNLLDKAERFFWMNAENYPTSYVAQKRMSEYYNFKGDKIREEEFKSKAETAKMKYGTRRSRVFPTGPIIDSTFDLHVTSPICTTNCPSIWVDDFHDFETLAKGWDYISLFNLLNNDGFKAIRGRGPFTTESLASMKVVVLAGGLMTRDEFIILNDWIKQGGSLLALVHHDGKAIYEEYLQTLGVNSGEISTTFDSTHGLLRDGFIKNPAYIYFSSKDKTLGDHVITRGRTNEERIKLVQTFATSAIVGPPGSINLLPVTSSAVDFMNIEDDINSRTPVRTDGSRSVGLAFRFGKGKVVVTDAWALKVLLFENSIRGKMGMNTPGVDNKQYALNIIRWLTGYLK